MSIQHDGKKCISSSTSSPVASGCVRPTAHPEPAPGESSLFSLMLCGQENLPRRFRLPKPGRCSMVARILRRAFR